jgi:hypothetical protein
MTKRNWNVLQEWSHVESSKDHEILSQKITLKPDLYKEQNSEIQFCNILICVLGEWCKCC